MNEQQARVDRWADLIESTGLSAVALSLLEMADAFGFLGHQVLLAIEPLVRDLSSKEIERTAHLVGNADVRAQLRHRLTLGRSDDE